MESTKTTTTATRKFGLNSVSFLVGTFLFLLPFVEIRCNGQPLASNTGIGLAFGTDYKTTSQKKSLDTPFGNKSEQAVTEKQEGEIYPSALIALILGVIGVIFSFLNPGSNRAALVIGGLAAICLIILMVQIQMDVKDKPFSKNEDGLGENIKITAEFTAWYYISLISFIAAAFFSYRKEQIVVST